MPNNVLESLKSLSDAILESHQEVLLELIDCGWEVFWREMFGDSLVDIFDSIETDDQHHSDAVEWHWEARLALLQNRRPPNDWFVYFPTFSRGHMKTTLARAMLITDALLTYAYGQKGYALIPGGTKNKIRTNAMSIEQMLHSPTVAKYCPALSKVQTNVYGRSRGWTSAFFSTEANYAFHFIGLDEGVAGANLDDTRVTFLIPDDIDGREDSPVISESRFRTLTSEILPTRQANTLVFWAQNLISRYSVRYKVESQQEKILTNRKPTVRIPAVRGEEWGQRTVDGIVQDYIKLGNSTWRGWDLQRINDEIATMGKAAFCRECLHQVEEDREGLILYNYDDNVHVISESEFAAVFGSKDAWLTWRKKPGNDWARTKTDKHANVATWLTVSSQETDLPNFTFLMYPMSFPADTAAEDVAERLISCLDPYAYESKGKKVTWRELRRELLKRINADEHTQTTGEKIAYEHGALARVIPKYTKPLLYRCNVQQGDMSHEADTARKIYTGIYGLGMKAVNPHKWGGTEMINRDMQVDADTPHPFRTGMMGYTRFFMVVPDDKESPYEHHTGKTVYSPRPYPLAINTKDLHDSDLWRFHFSNFRTQEPTLTKTGERIDEPLKLFDDAVQLLQMLYVGSSLRSTALTHEQKVQMLMPKQTLEAQKTARKSGDRLAAALNVEFQREIAELTIDPDRRQWYETLE